MSIIKDIQCILYIRHLNTLPGTQRFDIMVKLPKEKMAQIRRLCFIANPVSVTKERLKHFDRKYIHPDWFVCTYWVFSEYEPYLPEAPETNKPAERGQFAIIAKTKEEAEKEVQRKLQDRPCLFLRGEGKFHAVVRRPNLFERWSSRV